MKKKSFTVLRFKSRLNKERNTHIKLFTLDRVPDNVDASTEGIIHFTKRVGGQLHQMYSLAEYEYKPKPSNPKNPDGDPPPPPPVEPPPTDSEPPTKKEIATEDTFKSYIEVQYSYTEALPIDDGGVHDI